MQQYQDVQSAQYDRPNAQLARNRRHGKPRSKSEEAEDAPLILDQEGNVVQGASVDAHGEVRLGGRSDAKEDHDNGTEKQDRAGDGKKGEEAAAAGEDNPAAMTIGSKRKRKVGRVVCGNTPNDDDGYDDDKDTLARAIRAQGRSTGLGGDPSKTPRDKITKDGSGGRGDRATKRKKAKKVKLSFDDEEL